MAITLPSSSSSTPIFWNFSDRSFLEVHKRSIVKPGVASVSSFQVALVPTRPSLTARCLSSSPSRDEAFWLREEQRWLREEQRWVREEQRWERERTNLVSEIQSLKLRVQLLEGGGDETRGETLLEVPKTKGLIAASSGSAVGPVQLESNERRVLRVGSEGADVREMQEALQLLGFYSGEEDIEYSSFSRGTERAVKSWKASLGLPEDAAMTPQILEHLFELKALKLCESNPTKSKEEMISGVSEKEHDKFTVASTNEISHEEDAVTDDDANSHPRVFLLGENRWERPARIGSAINGTKNKSNTSPCLSCRGEGRLLCTECDGTGEPNIEPQFMEWMEEGAPCPYCEGVGFVTCDMCEAKTL